MLFEMAYNWLKDRLFRKKNCEHNFEKIGSGYSHVGYGEAYKYDKRQCTKCNTKEKTYTGRSCNYIYY